MSFSIFKKDLREWSDDRLVDAVISGDADAVVYMFYQKYASTFQYHIYKLFNYKVEDTDLIDEFFLFLHEDDWRRLRLFDSSKASLCTWISSVSFRFFRDYKRSKIDLNGLVTISDKWESFRGDWLESRDAGIDMDIRCAIDGIRNERDRKIAQRIFIDDCEFEVVAEEFNLSIDYVYTIKNRLSRQLKANLHGYL